MTRSTASPLARAFTRLTRRARALFALGAVAVVATACDVHGPSAPGSVASIVVTPNATLVAGSTQQMTAVGYDGDGKVVTITPTWSVANGGGTVAQTGVFTAGPLAGSFDNTVVATVGTITARASITVIAGPLASITLTPSPVTLAINGTQAFTAVGKDATGNTVPLTPTWSVAAGGGTISPTGVFTAGLVLGTYTNTVTVKSGLITATATVVVTAGPLATITVTPNPVTLALGSTQQMTAVGKDAGGNVLTTAFVWSIAASGGTINTTGLFTAGAVPGTFTNTIVATSGTISGTATVTVTSAPLATITVTPNPASMLPNGTQQFTAVGKDASGNVVAITPVWTITNGGGTINSTTGLFTAGATPGTYASTVTATSGTKSGLATVIVLGPLASIAVTPNPASVSINTVQQFTAVGKDASGNVVTITPTWTVANGGGTINGATGAFTAGAVTGQYTNTVVATSGTITGTATVTVTGPLATITVTPNPVTVASGGTQQFLAVGRDASNNIVTIAPNWSVANGGGTINNNSGLFTAGTTSGTFTNTVVATSGTVSGSATVTVTGALATIVVTPNPASVTSGGVQQFFAVGRDASNNILTITPTWSVAAGGGTISSTSGLFTAGATLGTFTNTVVATSGTITGTATVTVTAAAPPVGISGLGAAAPFGVLAGTGISCAISGTINGSASDIGSSPTLTVTGFPPCTYTGSIPTPAAVATAKGALTTAYLAAQALTCDVNLTGFDLGFYDGSTPTKSLAGDKVYCFNTSAGITGTLKLTGSATAKWTFQIGSTLNAEVGSNMILAGGAIADNIYWAVGSSATLKTNSQMSGNIMALASITLQAGSTLNGRALAQNGAVDMTAGAATITKP